MAKRIHPSASGSLGIPTALLLAAALLAGGSAFHPHAADHSSPAGAASDLPLFAAAAHPHLPPHAEAAGDRSEARCHACVLSLQSRGLEASSSPVPLPPPGISALRCAQVAAVAASGALPCRGRAPPRA